jgi:AraC-like DNA-binding protein
MINEEDNLNAHGGIVLDGASPFRLLAERQDLLSQVLTLIRLRGEIVYRGELSVASGLAFPAGPAHFYFVQQGQMVILPAASQAVELASGDLVLLPRGDGHAIVDNMISHEACIEPFGVKHFDSHKRYLRSGNNPENAARFIGGSFFFDGHRLASSLSILPGVIHIPSGASGTSDWLRGIAHFMLEETREAGPGSSLMVSRLIDLLVIRALRTWASAHPTNLGRLGALNEERIARVIDSMHNDPQKDWTLETLANIAAMSRSLFAEKFLLTVGEPPLRYLTRWRLTLAADLLKAGRLKVTEVARRTGYKSDAAFSRAFKAQFGWPPSDANRQ